MVTVGTRVTKALKKLKMSPAAFFGVCQQQAKQAEYNRTHDAADDDDTSEVEEDYDDVALGVQTVEAKDVRAALHQLTKLDITDDVLGDVMEVLAPGGEEKVTMAMMKRNLPSLAKLHSGGVAGM